MITGATRSTLRRSVKRLELMLRRNALANSTTTTYSRHWKQWCRLANKMGWSRWLTSATASKQLAFFATYCWSGGWNARGSRNQYSTIKLKLASIRWFHRRYKNLALPSSPKLDLLLQGIKRISAPKQKKQPLTPPFLRLLYRHLDISKPRQRLLWGSVLIGYFFLLRRSEFLKISNARRILLSENMQHILFRRQRETRISEIGLISVDRPRGCEKRPVWSWCVAHDECIGGQTIVPA